MEEEEMKRRKREKSERFQASEMEGGHVQGTEWAKDNPELSQWETGTSGLQAQGTRLCQQPELFCKLILP